MGLPKNKEEWSPVVLRVGLALVFIWFGVSQLLDPFNFVGYLPNFLFNSPFAQAVVYANGVFEIVAGILLLIGLFTRITSLLLGLHLLVIAMELGFTETGIRDFGLTLATLAVFLGGYDKWSMDYKRKK